MSFQLKMKNLYSRFTKTDPTKAHKTSTCRITYTIKVKTLINLLQKLNTNEAYFIYTFICYKYMIKVLSKLIVI